MYVSNEIVVDEPFVAGDTYLVNWDGTNYECVAKNALLENMQYIGSDAIFMDMIPEENEPAFPFMMATMMGENEGEYQLLIRTIETNESHTVSIRHLNVEKKTLAEDLLPVLYYGETQIGIVELVATLATRVLNTPFTREPIAYESGGGEE